MIKIAYLVDLSEMHHPEILLSCFGQIFPLLNRQTGSDINFFMLARIAKALVQVQEQARGDDLEKEKNWNQVT